MNDHERDLILALTEGTLSEEEAGEAMARVASDPGLAAELSIQQSVTAILGAMPEPELTANERSDLRASLIEELRLGETIAEVVPVRRGARWWQPVLGVAAVAAVVTAVVVLPGNLGGDDSLDVATIQETGSSSAVTTTVAASEAEDSASAGGAPEETAAATQTAEVLAVDGVGGDELLAATEGETTPEGVTRALGEQAPVATTQVPIDEIEACLEVLASRLPQGETQPVAIDARRDGDLLYLTVDPGDGVQAVVTIRLDTCTLVDIAR